MTPSHKDDGYYREHAEEVKARARNYYWANREEALMKQKERDIKRRGPRLCRGCKTDISDRAPNARYCLTCTTEKQKAARDKWRTNPKNKAAISAQRKKRRQQKKEVTTKPQSSRPRRTFISPGNLQEATVEQIIRAFERGRVVYGKQQ